MTSDLIKAGQILNPVSKCFLPPPSSAFLVTQPTAIDATIQGRHKAHEGFNITKCLCNRPSMSLSLVVLYVLCCLEMLPMPLVGGSQAALCIQSPPIFLLLSVWMLVAGNVEQDFSREHPHPPPCISYALVQATVGVGTVLIWYLILLPHQT